MSPMRMAHMICRGSRDLTVLIPQAVALAGVFCDS